ncbi:MAG: hypothetical protein PVJ51_08720 [Acidobacteriota bacterium]
MLSSPHMSAAGSRDTHATRLLIVLIVALVLLAWFNRFIQDDAFISFQYARNLAEGHGLTFNPGQRVEGYTNFLWTLMMAGGFALGVDPVAWSYVLGLTFFAGTLLLTYRLAVGLSGRAAVGLTAVLLLGGNFSFSSYATGGLETQSQAFFVVAAVWLSWMALRTPPGSVGLLAAASAAYGLALMTRLDSAVCLLLPGLLTLSTVARAQSGAGARAARVLALILPGFVLVAPWLAWKVSYYGGILPNTYYVKVSSAASLIRGGHYVYRFLASFWILPLLLLAVLLRPRELTGLLRRGRPAWGGALLAAIVVWFAYVASVGGDFMEFRFIVPVMPFMMILIAWALAELVEDRRLRVAVVIVLLVGSLLHGATFWGIRDIESIRNLAIHMEPDGGDWDEVGRTLGEYFAPDSGVTIAVGPAGVIPFYSRLRTIDMRGLVDPWVARNGIIVSTVPGHQRMAPLAYLVEQGANLVVGHPHVISRRGGLPEAFALASLAQLALADVSRATVPADAEVVAIPMPDDRWLLALYLVGHPAVDRAIADNGWPTVPLDDHVRGF